MPKYPLAMTTDGKKAKGKMKKMKPEAFLEAARKLTVGKGDRDIINKFKDDIKSGEPMGPLKLYKDGTEDGRHRATAAKELDLDSVPVIDERTAKAIGGALASEDPNKFFSDVMKFSFAVLPLLRPGYLKEVPKQGFAQGGHALEDDYPSHYLPEVGRQVMADGGVPGQRFAPIDPSMLVGTSPQPYRGGAAYTDPGGLKVAAPFVSGLAGGYPVFNLPAPSEPEKEEAPARPAPSGPDPMVLLALMKAAKMFAEGGAVEGDVSFAPPEVEQALKTAQEVADQRPFTEAAPEKAGEFGILPLRTEGEKVVFDPSAGSVTEFVKHALTPKISPVEIAKGAYEMGKGALEDISSAADYFKQTMTGQKPMEPTSEEAIKSALNIAGALTTGSFGATKPAGALAMGAARPAETEAYKRLVNPAGMYSRAHEVAMTELPETARTWQEMHALLSKAPRVQAEELYWSGIHPEAFPAGEKVSREQIADLIEKNFPKVHPEIRTTAGSPDQPRPKYEQYTVPGGTDYEERILKHEYRSGDEYGANYVHPEVKEMYAPQMNEINAERKRLADEAQKARFEYKENVVKPYVENMREEYVQKLLSGDTPVTTPEELAASRAARDAADAERKQATAEYNQIYNEDVAPGDIPNHQDRLNAAKDRIRQADRNYETLQDRHIELYANSEEGVRDDVSRLAPEIIANTLGKRAELQGVKLGQSEQMANIDALYQEQEKQLIGLRDKVLQESQARVPYAPEYAQQKYAHSHWPGTENPVVHTRNSTRIGPEGEKIWHQEELQSDWAQQGREKGFKDIKAEKALEEHGQQRQQLLKERDQLIENNLKTYRDALEPLRKEVDENISKAWEDSFAKEKEIGGDTPANSDKIQAIRQEAINKINQYKSAYEKAEGEITNNYWKTDEDLKNSFERKLAEHDANEPKVTSGPIPSAPYTRDTEHWLELAAKDTLAQAIERGYDKIFITGGQEQARRWANELRKSVDSVRWEPSTGGKGQAWKGFGTPQEQEAALQRFNDAKSVWSRMRTSDPGYAEAQREFQEAERAMKDIVPGWGRAEGDKPYGVREGDVSKVVYAKPKGGGEEHRFVVQQTEGPGGKPIYKVADSDIAEAKGQSLSSVIGGDLAKRVMAEESGNVPMKGYVMGSEGYTQTYERKAPSVYKKLLKSLDPEAKVETGRIGHKESLTPDEIANLNYKLTDEQSDAWEFPLHQIVEDMVTRDIPYAQAVKNHAPKDLAEYLAQQEGGAAGTYINITPKMREEYMRLKKKHGAVFPAYKRGGGLPPFKKGGKIDSALSLVRKLAGTPA